MWQRRPALRREAHVEVKMYNTSAPERFWKSRCRKRRRCGAKHISKWTCGKHTIVAALLEVEALKKFTFRCQVSKTHPCGTTFGSCDVEKEHGVVARSTFRSEHVGSTPCGNTFKSWDAEKVHAVVVRSTFRSQNVKTTPRSHHFWTLRCQKKCTPLWREAHFEVNNVRNAPRWDHFWKLRCSKSARRCCAKLRYATLHYTMLPYATPRYTTLHGTTLHYTMLHFTTHHTNPRSNFPYRMEGVDPLTMVYIGSFCSYKKTPNQAFL